MSTCATSAPLSLATDTTNSLKDLEQTLVATYPVTVNSAPPAAGGRDRAGAERAGAPARTEPATARQLELGDARCE